MAGFFVVVDGRDRGTYMVAIDVGVGGAWGVGGSNFSLGSALVARFMGGGDWIIGVVFGLVAV